MGRSLLKILLESPDQVDSGKYSYHWEDKNAVAFQITNGDLYSTYSRETFGKVRGQMHDGILDNPRYEVLDYDVVKAISQTHGYKGRHGRVWFPEGNKPGMISFWSYPKTAAELRDIVGKLEADTGKKIWNQGFGIEVRKGHGFFDEEVVPLEDYKKSKNPDVRVQHQASPMDKKKTVVPKGMGSEKDVPNARPGETPAQTRQRTTMNEKVNPLSKLAETLRDVIKESIDSKVEAEVAFDYRGFLTKHSLTVILREEKERVSKAPNLFPIPEYLLKHLDVKEGNFSISLDEVLADAESIDDMTYESLKALIDDNRVRQDYEQFYPKDPFDEVAAVLAAALNDLVEAKGPNAFNEWYDTGKYDISNYMDSSLFNLDLQKRKTNERF